MSMMGFVLDENESGPLQDYFWLAVSETFSLTEAQIEAFEIVRETIHGIQEDFSQAEIRDIMEQAMTTAIENALADGAITQEQADRLQVRLGQLEGVTPAIPLNGKGIYLRGFSNGLKLGRQMVTNHEYLDAAIADILDISVEDLQKMKTDEGYNLKAYAEEQGLCEDELSALRKHIFTKAINAALEDGAITQEHADWILEHLENKEGRGGWINQP